MERLGNQRKRRLRLAATGIAALAMFGALAFVYFRLCLPMGSGPAGPPVPRDAFARVWSERPVVLLGLGDSVTRGFGAEPGRGYFDRLVENPPGDAPDMNGICLRAVFSNLSVRNDSVNASTSIDLVERQLPALRPYPADTLGFVVMSTGGNDLIHMYGRTPPQEGAMYGATLEQAQPWIDNFGKRIDNIVSTVRAAFPGGCEIFLANLYDPSDGVADPSAAGLPPWPDVHEIVDAYNTCIASCAKKHDFVHLVDLHAAFLGHGVTCRQFWRSTYDSSDPHYWYYENLEDPNDRGYDAIRRLFLLEMLKVGPSLRAIEENASAPAVAANS